MDSDENIFLVNTHLKDVKCIHTGHNYNKHEHILFNSILMLRLGDESASITHTKGNEIEVELNHEKYLYSMIDENIVQVNKTTAKIRKFNLIL